MNSLGPFDCWDFNINDLMRELLDEYSFEYLFLLKPYCKDDEK